MKPYKQHKRRYAGRLRKLTKLDRERRAAHARRTGRADKLFAKRKVIPSDDSR